MKNNSNSKTIVIPAFHAEIQPVSAAYWHRRAAKYAELDKLTTSPYFDNKQEKKEDVEIERKDET